MFYCYGKAELDSSYFAKAASYEIFSAYVESITSDEKC